MAFETPNSMETAIMKTLYDLPVVLQGRYHIEGSIHGQPIVVGKDVIIIACTRVSEKHRAYSRPCINYCDIPVQGHNQGRQPLKISLLFAFGRRCETQM